VTKINYRRLVRVVNQKLIHDIVKIQNDVDIKQIINC